MAKKLVERFVTGGPITSNVSIKIGPGAVFQRKAEELAEEYGFVGGPVEDFEVVARLQLITLLREGLYPHSKVVDIGCGLLRGGYWLIHFLDEGCYCGIEPNAEMLDIGRTHLIESEELEAKKPRFDTNDEFDTSVFGETFDFFLARSVWTHASKPQIEVMLDRFVRDTSEEGIFLTSYWRADWLRSDYHGTKWVGRSHESDESGRANHRFEWIRRACRERNLEVSELEEGIYNEQIWLRITKDRGTSKS